MQTAQEQLDAVSPSLEKQYPDTNLGMRARIAPLRDDLVQNVKDSLRALFGASGLIVLITCVNVANLLLVRAVGRRHETSVRLALGAGRMRIVRQFLAESMMLAAAGCAAGILLRANSHARPGGRRAAERPAIGYGEPGLDGVRSGGGRRHADRTRVRTGAGLAGIAHLARRRV